VLLDGRRADRRRDQPTTRRACTVSPATTAPRRSTVAISRRRNRRSRSVSPSRSGERFVGLAWTDKTCRDSATMCAAR
jgi:hypothetical protein